VRDEDSGRTGGEVEAPTLPRATKETATAFPLAAEFRTFMGWSSGYREIGPSSDQLEVAGYAIDRLFVCSRLD